MPARFTPAERAVIAARGDTEWLDDARRWVPVRLDGGPVRTDLISAEYVTGTAAGRPVRVYPGRLRTRHPAPAREAR